MAVAACTRELSRARLEETLFLGEIALDASLRPVRGLLSLISAPHPSRVSRAVVPGANRAEASLQRQRAVLLADELGAVVGWLEGNESLAAPSGERDADDRSPLPDLADVRGPESARRALEIAAAGGHNLLMGGPPGSGKTLLARRLPGLLPSLGPPDALEVSKIHSVAGALGRSGWMARPPLRASARPRIASMFGP